MAVKDAVWSARLPGARRDFYAYTVPVVTDDSVIYRHKNVVYSRSILNGELRWQNDLGGRARWQRRLHYTHEDVLVRDGFEAQDRLVVTHLASVIPGMPLDVREEPVRVAGGPEQAPSGDGG